MNITIRKALITDLTTIQDLNNQLFELELNNFDKDLKENWPFSESGKAYFEDLIKNCIVFVAENKETIVGYIAGRINFEESYVLNMFAELENMYIKEEFKNKGIGTRLINEFKNECKNKDVASIRVTASYENKKAIDFYRKHLFVNKDITLLCELNSY